MIKQFLSSSYLSFGEKLPKKSTTFVILKYTLLVFICVVLTAAIVLIPFGPKVIRDLEPNATPEELSAYKTELTLGMMVILLFFSLGFYGVFREDFCASTAFTVFMVFLLIGSIADEANGIGVISVFALLSIAFCALLRHKVTASLPGPVLSNA
jgi:hypothetical protein